MLDLFSGSASLLVACHQLKRSAYLIEKKPVFAQLAINRYEKISHEKAFSLSLAEGRNTLGVLLPRKDNLHYRVDET